MVQAPDNAAPAMGARLRRWGAALDSFGQKEWRWLVVIVWLLICAYYIDRYSAAIHYLSLGDTDDNMRYLQVRDWLFGGQSWWDLTQHRMDPPRGANIHWSRLVDLPIAALMLFFRLFTSDARADQLAVGVAPLLPLLVLMLALAFLARRLAADEQGHGWFAAMLLPLGAGMGLSMYVPLRIDHHGWQLALTATTLAGLVDKKWRRGGIVAGVSSAASAVIGMEMLVYLAGAGGLIALRWIFKDGAERRLRPYALGLGGASALGYALFASNANRMPVCDALSPIWTSIFVLAAGVLYGLTLLPLRGWPQRLAAAAVGGAIVAGFTWIAWPQCLAGPYAMISPELQQKWLVYIREAKPIYSQARSSWVPMISLPVMGLVCALAGCWAARRDADRLWAWGTVMIMIAFAIGLTFWQIRAGPAAQLLAIPPVAWAIWALVEKLFTGRWLQRALAVPALSVIAMAVCVYGFYPWVTRSFAANNAATPAKPAPNALKPASNATAPGKAGPEDATDKPAPGGGTTANSAAVRKPAAKSEARCRTQPALQVLDQLPPATIFTVVDLGPRLIAITHHSAIAGPYHRNGKAILDIHHAFDGSPENFRQIAAAHGATYFLLCPNFPEGTIYQRRSPRGFYARIARGEAMPFLTPVTLNFAGTLPYTLYRIAPLVPDSAPIGKKAAQ